MAPEYGATCGIFPVDEETLRYMRFTGRTEERVALVEAYAKAQGMWRTKGEWNPVFTDTLSLDLSTVEPSLAGPKRPQDRVALSGMVDSAKAALDEVTETQQAINEELEELARLRTALDGELLRLERALEDLEIAEAERLAEAERERLAEERLRAEAAAARAAELARVPTPVPTPEPTATPVPNPQPSQPFATATSGAGSRPGCRSRSSGSSLPDT